MTKQQKLSEELTRHEVDQLTLFLSECSMVDIPTLHGSLTAIVSGPNMIMPSEWMDYLGLTGGEFESMEEANRIMGTVMRFYNSICHHLQNQTLDVEKVLKNYGGSLDQSTLFNHWVRGYMLGVGLDKQAWMDEQAINSMLFPIFALRTDTGSLDEQNLNELAGADFDIDEVRAFAKEKISDLVNAIYQHFLKLRQSSGFMPPVRERTMKIGRNEPCPCGSGKKYKKCCLKLH